MKGLVAKGMEVREKIAALICLTAIAFVAMVRIEDSENIVINVVVAIAAFISGGGGRRAADSQEPKEPDQAQP